MLEKLHNENNSGKLLFQVLKNTIDMREELVRKDFMKMITEAGKRNEYKTIKINLGRQAGHTTAAVELLREYKNALMIVIKQDNVHHAAALLDRAIASHISTHELSKHIVTTSQLFSKVNVGKHMLERTGGINPDIVILDCATYANVSESALWETFPDMQYLVMLG